MRPVTRTVDGPAGAVCAVGDATVAAVTSAVVDAVMADSAGADSAVADAVVAATGDRGPTDG